MDGRQMIHTLQFFDVASDDTRRSTFHAICHEFFLGQFQERGASNLIVRQDVQCSLAQLVAKFFLMSCSVLHSLMLVMEGDFTATTELPNVYEEPDKVMDE